MPNCKICGYYYTNETQKVNHYRRAKSMHKLLKHKREVKILLNNKEYKI